MSKRAHTRLRLGALVLLAVAFWWPRSHALPGAHAQAQTSGPRVETAAARLHSPPRTVKLVLATAEDQAATH